MQKLLDDLTSSFTTTCCLLQTNTVRKRRNSILSNRLAQMTAFLRSWKRKGSCSGDSWILISLKNKSGSIYVAISSKRTRNTGKSVKVLRKQKEHDFYTLLETKSLREQQRMIRFERNGKQRPGVKRLDSDKLPEYSGHFANIFSSRDGSTNTSTLNGKLKIADMPKFSEVSEFFTLTHIRGFIKSESNGKAAGCSGISTELMKPVASRVAMVLGLIAEIMYARGSVQEYSGSRILFRSLKRPTAMILKISDISLIEVPRRIIEKCMALLLKPFERGLSPMQGGFREDRSTLDQAATLHQILSTRFNDAKPTIVAFLDIKSAYDCVNRRLLWACCEKAGIPDPVIRMLSGMFDHNRSRVVVDGVEGEWFPCSVGVMQGSSLSPLLYALYIDELPITLHSKFSSLPLGTTSVNSILYADDIALVASQGIRCKACLITVSNLLRRGGLNGEYRNARCSSLIPQLAMCRCPCKGIC